MVEPVFRTFENQMEKKDIIRKKEKYIKGKVKFAKDVKRALSKE